MGRDVKYIQLPPLPEDIEMPALEVIWLIARMNPEQRKDALKQIEAIAGTENDGKADYEAVEAILDKYENVGEDDVFSQYHPLFRDSESHKYQICIMLNLEKTMRSYYLCLKSANQISF